MVKPVLRAVDNDEPMEFLAEVRRVVIVFLNIITKSVSEELLIRIVDNAYKIVCRSEYFFILFFSLRPAFILIHVKDSLGRHVYPKLIAAL